VKKAVVVLSGGLDSTTCAALAREAGYELYPLTFDYGQRHRVELGAARKIAAYYGAADRHKIVRLDFFRDFGGSALTDDSIAVPERPDGAVPDDEIPVTYVPGRNLIFLSVAVSYAETIAAEAVYIGVNALDYSGYPDCRPEFVRSFEQTAALATKAGVGGRPVRIETPLVRMTKADIVREGVRLGVPFELTWSCYKGGDAPCGVCDSCLLRRKGFAEAGVRDPLEDKAGASYGVGDSGLRP